MSAKNISIGLITLALTTVVGFFIYREILLWSATRNIESSLSVLGAYADRNVSGSECLAQSDGGSDDSLLPTYQLRFLNDNEYILEAVCPLTQSTPIELERRRLPKLTQKVPGKSGFVWGEGLKTGIKVQVFGELDKLFGEIGGGSGSDGGDGSAPLFHLSRQRIITLDSGVVDTKQELLPDSQTPVASCEGYGYSCCDEVSQVGVGEKINGAISCNQRCFSKCVDRPTVLSFVSEPYVDPFTNKVEVFGGMPVVFAFKATKGSSEGIQVYLDFGDDVQESTNSAEGQFVHQYECSNSSCAFTARLDVVNDDGVAASNLPINELSIVVRQ